MACDGTPWVAHPEMVAHISALQSFVHVPLGKSLPLNLNFVSASPACRVSWDAGDKASCTSHPAHSMGPQLPVSPDSAPPDTQPGQDSPSSDSCHLHPQGSVEGGLGNTRGPPAPSLHWHGLRAGHCIHGLIKPSASGHYGDKETEPGGRASPAK